MKLLIWSLFLMVGNGVLAQEAYYVLHVQGIVKKKTGEPLAPKDKLDANDELTFSSESAFVVAFSNKDGRKVIRPVNKNETSTSLISYFVNQNLFPTQKQLSTRGGEMLRSFSDLKKYFASPVLIIGSLRLPLDVNALGIGDDRFLTFSSKDGTNDIKAQMDGNELIISTGTINNVPDEGLQLNFRDESFGSSMPLSDVNLIFKEMTSFKDELAFYESISGTKFTEETLKDYLESVYGKFDKEYLKSLLE